jgi:ribosomal protein S18 acetylase RimI-like enzyme
MSLSDIDQRPAADRRQRSDAPHHPNLDRPSPLASELEAKTQDLDWVLANFAFVANVTTLAAECDIAHSPAMSVASCRSLPRLGLAFVGDSSKLLATYAAFLADPGSEVCLLVNEDQREVVERAFEVRAVIPRWQLLYRGDASVLDPKSASELVENDLPAVQALVRAEKVGLSTAANDLLKNGPAFGIWERRKLVAAGMTGVCLPRAAQVGQVITRKEFRRQGYASAVLSALLLAHLAQGRSVFAVVDQDATETLSFYERLGFSQERILYSMVCLLRHSMASAE